MRRQDPLTSEAAIIAGNGPVVTDDRGDRQLAFTSTDRRRPAPARDDNRREPAMDLQFSTACLPYPLGWSFATARALGVDGIELSLTPALARKGPDQVLRLSEGYGVPIRSVALDWGGGAPPAREEIGGIARFAAALPRCRVLVLPAPRADGRALSSGGMGPFLHLVRALNDALPAGRVALTVENPPGLRPDERPGLLVRFPQLRRLVEEWDLGFTFNTSYAGSSGWVITEPLPQMGARLRNVHLGDFRPLAGRRAPELPPGGVREEHLRRLPGDGILPLRALLRALSRREYAGLLTLDVHPRHLRAWWPPAARGRLAEALAFCRAAARDRGIGRRLDPFERAIEAPAEAEAENEG